MKKLRLFDSLKFVVAAIVCAFILNVAHAATLPAGYTELEYIEGTGTQYIDTGYKPNAQNVKYVYSVQSTSTDTAERHPARIAGGRIQIYRIGDHWSIYESSPSVSSSSIPNLGIMDKVDFVVENNYDNSLTILANNINVTGNYTPRSNTYTITLFAFSSNSSKFIGRVYYFRVYENGVLRFNAVPVRRDSDGVLGMYDLADSNPETAFHTNAGTGEFIAGEYQIKIATTKYNEQQFAPVETQLDAAVAAVDTVVTQTMNQAQAIDTIATTKQTRPDEGCTAKYCLLVEDEDGTPHWYPIAGANGVEYVLPAGYTQLTYIQSDGRQVINTGYVLQETDSVEVDYKLTDLTRTSDKFILGAQPVSDTSIGGFWVETYNDTNDWYVRYGSETSANTYGSVTPTSQLSGTLAVSKNSFVVNGVEILNPNFVSMPVNPMTIFSRISRDGSIANNGASAQISEVRVKNGNNIVHRYIAVRNSNNEIGMYDTVSGQFFTNAGTGAFIAGPDM